MLQAAEDELLKQGSFSLIRQRGLIVAKQYGSVSTLDFHTP